MKQIFCRNILCAMLAAALCAGLLAGCNGSAPDSASDSISDGTPDSASVSEPASGDAQQDGTQDGTQDAGPLDYSAGLDENGFIEGFRALDHVTLPDDYAAIPIPADAIAVTDEDVQEEIDIIAWQFAETEQITDRAVEDNEYVNIDYAGFMDGEQFAGGTATDQRVLSGSRQFIDDFLTQIIGHMPGETFDVEVTFPDPYEKNPDYSGKDAVFEVTINYIEGEAIVPEFDDAFVSENLAYYYGWQTVEDARDEIEQVLYESNLSDFVWDYLLDNTRIPEVPQAVTDYHTSMLLNRLRSEAQMYGVSSEVYLQMMMGLQDEEAFLEQQAEYIVEAATQWMIVQAIAEDAGIIMDDDALAAYFLETMGVEDYSEYEANFGRPYLCMAVTSDTVNNMIQAGAVIG